MIINEHYISEVLWTTVERPHLSATIRAMVEPRAAVGIKKPTIVATRTAQGNTGEFDRMKQGLLWIVIREALLFFL